MKFICNKRAERQSGLLLLTLMRLEQAGKLFCGLLSIKLLLAAARQRHLLRNCVINGEIEKKMIGNLMLSAKETN